MVKITYAIDDDVNSPLPHKTNQILRLTNPCEFNECDNTVLLRQAEIVTLCTIHMSEEDSAKKAKIGSKLSGLGKAAIKQKAAITLAGAIKPATDAVSEKIMAAKDKAKSVVEEKATEIAKDQMKKEAKKKFFNR